VDRAIPAGVKRPTLAHQAPGEQDMHSVRAPVGGNSQSGRFTADADLDDPVGGTRLRERSCPVHRQRGLRACGHVHAAVAPEQHEGREPGERRSERIAPDAILRGTHPYGDTPGGECALTAERHDSRRAAYRPPRHLGADRRRGFART
jgi:hypothetical protein